MKKEWVYFTESDRQLRKNGVDLNLIEDIIHQYLHYPEYRYLVFKDDVDICQLQKTKPKYYDYLDLGLEIDLLKLKDHILDMCFIEEDLVKEFCFYPPKSDIIMTLKTSNLEQIVLIVNYYLRNPDYQFLVAWCNDESNEYGCELSKNKDTFYCNLDISILKAETVVDDIQKFLENCK